MAKYKYEVGSPEGFAEAKRRIAEAAANEARTLSLNGLGLAEIPSTIGKLRFLRELYLSNNELCELPAAIRELKTLQDLDLSNNQLSELPAAFWELVSLQELGLSENHLSELPATIGELKSLRCLYLDHNQLGDLPTSFGELNSLKVLHLNNNHLGDLPAPIGQLYSLEGLYLQHNQIDKLPEAIGELKSLEVLELNHNRLGQLPSAIGQLKSLRILLLKYNQLRELPASIGGIKNLYALELGGNPLPDSYTKAYLDGGIEALCALLRGLADEGAPLYEAKLLVTGEGAVGKSWALAAFQGKDPKKEVGKQTTYGIDRGIQKLPHPSEMASVTLNTWDFGGQKVYRVTHQFFFSEEAVFLLVWNPRQGAEQCQVRQWLRRIELRTGGNARVIMVATHCPIEKTPYRPDYGHDSLPVDLQAMIVDQVAIDSQRKEDGGEGDNIQKLRDMIAKHAANLPGMGDNFPEKWRRARKNALALHKVEPYIRYRRFEEICAAEGITDAEQIFTLARVFMHKLGRAVYNGERRPVGSDSKQQPVFRDVTLADVMVLDAEWLTKAFVRVLDDENTKAAGGMLDHGHLDVIWRTHGRDDWTVYQPEEHEFLIRLMGAFDISYVDKHAHGDKSLVAEMVPERRPVLPWLTPGAGEKSSRLVCALNNEVPGLMSRFIVRTSPYHVKDEEGHGLFWTGGVFLHEPTFGDEALVTIEGVERPVVTLMVRGEQPGWFLGELYRTLNNLLDFWPGLDKTYHALCPTVREDGDLCAGRFDFDFLVAERREHANDNQICQTCRSRWKPGQLLFGYDGVAQQREHDLKAAHARFLAKQDAPCPRSFTLWPSDGSYYDPSAVELIGKKLRLTLYSEHSGKAVVSKDFTVPGDWVKWLRRVARLTSIAMQTVALPLTGDIEDQLSEATKFMTSIGGLAGSEGSDEEVAKHAGYENTPRWVSGADAELLHDFLKQIGLAPKFGGMKFVKIRNKGWLWVSPEEAEAHAEVEPVLAYVPKEK